MPLHDFQCKTCLTLFEVMEPAEDADEPKKYCPKCKRKRKVDYIFARTAKPILRAGVGGFASPTPEDTENE